jgi:Phage integrase family
VLDPDPQDTGNQGAFLLGKASDAAERAPGLNAGQLYDPREGIAATRFYGQIKAFFTDCAGVLRGQGEVKGAERLARASTHWMRHSHASHAIAGGMPIEIAQQNLGHVSLATITVYVTTEAKRRMKAVGTFLGESHARAIYRMMAQKEKDFRVIPEYEELVAGVLVREGSPAPSGPTRELNECHE